jgi:hypothetical protein
VALECDGERFHTIDNLQNDMARQAILERLGWRFVRIRGSEYYRNPETTMLNVLSYLEKEGIYPKYNQSEDLSSDKSLLITSLKNKAAICRGKIPESHKFTDNNARDKHKFDFRKRTGPVKTMAISKKITNVSSDKGLSKPKFDFSDKK